MYLIKNKIKIINKFFLNHSKRNLTLKNQKFLFLKDKINSLILYFYIKSRKKKYNK